MIDNIREFKRLLKSNDPTEYGRITTDIISEKVSEEIIRNYPQFIQYLVWNEHLSLNIIKKLVSSDIANVRWKIAGKPNLPFEIYKELSQDEDESVRLSVALNHSTPLSILLTLVDDEWKVCADAALSTIQEVKEQIRTLGKRVIKSPQEEREERVKYLNYLHFYEEEEEKNNENFEEPPVFIPNEELKEFSDQEVERLNQFMSEMKKAEEDELSNDDYNKLSQSKFRSVRLMIANNYLTPLKILKNLTKDQDRACRDAAIKNLKERKKSDRLQES